jgi:hypothetical protein
MAVILGTVVVAVVCFLLLVEIPDWDDGDDNPPTRLR